MVGGRDAMKITLMGVLALGIVVAAGCQAGSPGMWELKCAACHDGVTQLNGQVVPDREQLKAEYRSLDAFVESCTGAPPCMNILKHDKSLLREVGGEIGVGG
jgi:hypothetical protein